MTITQKFIRDLVTKHPTASTRALARMAYKSGRTLFSSEERARVHIYMYRRGSNGTYGLSMKLPASPYTSGRAFEKLPEGKTEFDAWNAVKLNGKRALILSDSHIPYHDRTSLLAAIEYGKKNAADLIVLNGDIADFFSVSFWEKDPRARDFKKEIETTREFLSALRKTFRKADIIYKLGNHEERFIRYMRVRAPELLDIEAFEIQSLLGFKKLGIELVGEKRPMQLGDLNIIHGHEYRFAISNPVNPARGLFLRCKDYALCGHFHQSSYHSEKTVKQRAIATWSLGCLCDVHPEYMPMNNWSHGFAFVEVGNNGKFQVQNKTIKNGTIY